MRIHRVGTLTFGILLVTFGMLFLLRIFIPDLSYEFILKLWPIVFILLGIEILIANIKQSETKLIYDKTAFFLIIVLSFFAMGMAFMEEILRYVINYRIEDIHHIF